MFNVVRKKIKLILTSVLKLIYIAAVINECHLALHENMHIVTAPPLYI